MVLYECECCLFCSKLKSNYIRHLKSNKHFRNMQKSVSVMVKTKGPDFLCDFCDSKFSTYVNKRKHELHKYKENI